MMVVVDDKKMYHPNLTCSKNDEIDCQGFIHSRRSLWAIKGVAGIIGNYSPDQRKLIDKLGFGAIKMTSLSLRAFSR